MRFMRGPSLATACLTYKLSRSTSNPFSVLRKLALSIADCSNLPTVAATRFLVNSSVLRASSTRRPLINSSTSRAFCGDTRIYRASARNSIVCSQSRLAVCAKLAARSCLCLRRRWCRGRDRSRAARRSRRFCRNFSGRPHRVSLKLAGETEFAQLVSHHVLGHIDGDEFSPVVHSDRVTDHLRRDGRTPRPGAQHLLLVACVHAFDLGGQVRVHERPFFCRTCHKVSLFSCGDGSLTRPAGSKTRRYT